MLATHSSTFKVSPDLAFLTEGWANGLADALREHRPKRMELVGAWDNLHLFSGLVDSVENLRIAGTIMNGKVNSVSGIEVFKNLRGLEIVSKVKAGYDMSALTALERCDVVWQSHVHSLLALPSMRDAHVHAFPHANFQEFPENRLHALRLGQPALTSLKCIENLTQISNIRFGRARKLTSLDGVEAASLESIEINEARQLTDISSLQSSSLKELRLINVSTSIDLSTLAKISNLRRVHIAGKGVPTLPWLQLVQSKSIQWISGMWDSDIMPETAIRDALPAGRRFARFDAVGSKGVRPLWIELE